MVLARDADPADGPVLVLRAAAAAAQAGLRLAPHTVERLAAESRADAASRGRAAARRVRLACSGPAPRRSRCWEALDQAGLIVRADAGLGAGPQPAAAQRRAPVHRRPAPGGDRRRRRLRCTRHVDRPDLLLVGALLHDIGKGWPGDHTEAGVAVVADLGAAAGLRRRTTSTVLVTLVRHHLLLPDTATRRDLDDPATIAHVAAAVGTLEVLDLLHALTEADALATGPAAWSEWKAALIADLVARTHAVLARSRRVPQPRRPDRGAGDARRRRRAGRRGGRSRGAVRPARSPWRRRTAVGLLAHGRRRPQPAPAGRALGAPP